jgi:hypothetical protein
MRPLWTIMGLTFARSSASPRRGPRDNPDSWRTLALLDAAVSLVAGVLAVCGGLCYLILLVPPLAGYLSPWYLAPDVIAEPVLMLWLLIVGLNPQRWRQQAGQTGLRGARTARSLAREVTPSLGKSWYRWVPTVRCEM